jgi:hypothetical protein
MRVRLPLVTVGLGLALTAPRVLAQALPVTVPLDSGRLVRLRLTDGTVVRGRLLEPLSRESGALLFCRYPAPPCSLDSQRAVRLHAALVTAVEVKRGTRVWRGIAIGAGIGAALGWFAGSFYNWMCDYYGCGTLVPAWVMAGAIQFGAWGALFGSQSVVWGPAP